MAHHKILIVDDDPQVRGVLRDALKLGDFEAVLAADGPAALAAVQESVPDLVVLDLGMPGMSGLEVLDRLHAQYPDLPLVILSGLAHPEDTPDLIARGARAILGKPFGARDFLRVIESALAR